MCSTASRCVGFRESSSIGKKYSRGVPPFRAAVALFLLVQAHLEPPNGPLPPGPKAGPLVVGVQGPVGGSTVEAEAPLARRGGAVFGPGQEPSAEPPAGLAAPDRQPVHVAGVVRDLAPYLLVGPLKDHEPDGTADKNRCASPRPMRSEIRRREKVPGSHWAIPREASHRAASSRMERISSRSDGRRARTASIGFAPPAAGRSPGPGGGPVGRVMARSGCPRRASPPRPRR